MLDVVVVGYRSEAFLPRLFDDIKSMTFHQHTLHYFDNTGNPKTLTRAWNDLANEGVGGYIAFLNPDIALSTHWDKRLSDVLASSQSVGIATADPWKFSLEIPSRRDMEEAAKACAGRTGLYGDRIHFFTAMMERATWSYLKGFDERARFYMQDIDFIVRAYERLGKSTRRVEACPIWHGWSASTKEARKRKEVDSNLECAQGDAIFDGVRHGRLREWQDLSDEERRVIRADERYSRIGAPI